MEQNPMNPSSRRLSRRAFLGGSAAAAFALSGCGVTRSGGREYELGSSQSLRVMNWEEYIDPELIPGLGASANIPNFEYSETYTGNAEIWDSVIAPNLANGNPTGWDIMMPTYWQAARMIENGWVEPLPIELIPNHANLDTTYMTLDWDRGARMQMPWQSGMTGIAFNTRVVDPGDMTSIDRLFAGDFPGPIGMIPEMREALGFVMLTQGEDPSRPTVETATAALVRLENLHASGRLIWTYDFAAALKADFGTRPDEPEEDRYTGEPIFASMAWSGDTVLLQDELQTDSGALGTTAGDINFVIPDEGAIQWFDTMVIPKGSPNIAAAGNFMNAVYDPQMAADITEWVLYISPVVGVRDELLTRDSAVLATNPLLFPDDATRRRLFTWGQLPTADELALEERFNAIAGQ